MDFDVVIPDGCTAGSEMVVEVGGQELIVIVPDGCLAGDTIVVTAPPPPPPSTPGKQSIANGDAFAASILNVTVPDGCAGGSEIIVDVADGRSLNVVVPAGLQPGDVMEVDVSDNYDSLRLLQDADDYDSQPPTPKPATPQPSTPSKQQHSEQAAALANWPRMPPSASPPKPPPPKPPPTPKPAPPPPPPEEPKRVLPAELSDSSDDEVEYGKFGPGQPVEVLRSDGTWTLATVAEFDETGCTYTITLIDGRQKYFVEEEDLRIPRFLLLSTANI